MAHDWDKCLSVALNLCNEVSQIIRERIWDSKKEIQTKASKHDFVTETDQQVEKLLITGLSNAFPDHKFIGEETTSSGVKAELTNAPTWIIDPVDGTMNFVHGYPNVCVSIGLAYEKKLVLGIVSVPVNSMMFTAIEGKGAFLNGKPIHASKTTNLEDALIAIEMTGAGASTVRFQMVSEQLNNILPHVQGVRTSGSAAFNMAMVALGGVDAYFDIGLHAWDIAGGAVIVREAGGVVLDSSGDKELDIMSRRVLCAGTKELALQISKHIVQSYPTRDGE